MRVFLNGRERELARSMSITHLLNEVGIRPEMTAVELNQEVVKRAYYDQTLLKENDKVEIVTMMGGG